MNANTLKAITRHGETLLRAFPNCAEKNPVALCKKLRRIETSLARPLEDYCNGVNITSEELDEVCDKAKARVVKILGMDERKINVTGLFINRDPRGYALKLSDEWARDFRLLTQGSFYTDMGGYGILAPDLNQ